MKRLITDNRALTAAVQTAAVRYGIDFRYLSGGWVIRLEKAGQVQFLFAYSNNLNSHASGLIATDKVAVYELLRLAGLPVVPHFLVRSLTEPAINEQTVSGLFDRFGTLVIKPLRGGHGKHVSRHDSLETVRALNRIAHVEMWAAAPYVVVHREVRCVMLDGEILLMHEKIGPVTHDGLPMFNLSHGARPRDLAPDTMPAVVELAIAAMPAIGLRFGAVDIVELADGRWQVLEINSGFALEHYAKSSPERRQRVIDLYVRVIADLMAIAA
jgi:glutathione synthase/RimK-type ligase-like ATP-grasp enzyme